ncbi:MAG: carboxypeptidase-like regulatory domain-containing protein, partial [Saprospiraceae bacterium]|nr:carboxypeptidase-like regulatory domain-containing protein [Saprospiraceae bacterium]
MMPFCQSRFRFFLVGCMLLFVSVSHAQLTGRVVDPEGTPLVFVSILVEGAENKVVISDLEGRFLIPDSTPPQLTFRYVGYETLQLDEAYMRQHAPSLPDVVLRPTTFSLAEVVIRPGINPAERLIRLAIQNRSKNNPERYPFFTCNTYNKINFSFVPHHEVFAKTMAGKDVTKEQNREKLEKFQKLERITRTQHLFFMETVTERSFRFPNQNQEKVLLNRVSGTQNLGMVAIANAVQPFSFYNDFIRILDRDFANPIAPGSVGQYVFTMKDTLLDGADTLWTIAFQPRKGKVFNGLSGVLQLHSDSYAVKNVRATTTGTPFIVVKIEQAYQQALADDGDFKWFPEQLNFEMNIPSYPDKTIGTHISGRSFISSVDLQTPTSSKDFMPEMPVFMVKNATNQQDSAWAVWRSSAPLSTKEKRTYVFLDSLFRAQKIGWLTTLVNYSVTGKAHLYKGLSVDLKHVLKFNDFEGTRLGIGLTNAESRPLRLPKRLEVGAYAGFGFTDKKWKYGGYGLWRLTRARNTQLRASWRNDLLEPGALHELTRANLVNRGVYARRMDYVEEWSASLGSQITRALKIELTGNRQDWTPAYEYGFAANDQAPLARQFRFAESTVYIRYARNLQNNNFLVAEENQVQRTPVVELAYTRGWKGVLDGEYEYDRWVLALRQNVYVRRLGRLNWR